MYAQREIRPPKQDPHTKGRSAKKFWGTAVKKKKTNEGLIRMAWETSEKSGKSWARETRRLSICRGANTNTTLRYKIPGKVGKKPCAQLIKGPTDMGN